MAFATLGSTASASAQSLVTGSELNATMQTIQSLLQANREGAQQLEARVARIEQKLGIEYVAPDENGVVPGEHAYIDLGVVREDGAHVYWATCNVGAVTQSQAGRKFAWGDIRQVNMTTFSFEWPTYCFMQDGKEDVAYITKYTVDDHSDGAIWYDSQENFIGDGLVELVPADDAARQLWGGSWRIPTLEEASLLISQCDWEWTTMNASPGYKVYNKSDHQKFIFLPAAGWKSGTDENLRDEAGWYWTSSLTESDTPYAWFLNFDSNNKYPDAWDRSTGLSIRPVCSPF